MAKSVAGRYLTIPGLIAGDSLAAKQYHVVKMASTDGEVLIASSTTDVMIGLVQNDPAADEPAEVACAGVAIGKSGDSITIGEMVNANSTGELRGTAGAISGTERILGIALEAASDGDLFSVLITPQTFLA